MGDNLTTEAAAAVLDHIHGVATLTITLPLKLAVTTNIPDADTAGIEVAGGSYARQTITLGASGGSDTTSNTNAPSFTMPTCVARGFKIYDSSATPKALWQGELSEERPYTAGDVAVFDAGDLIVVLR